MSIFVSRIIFLPVIIVLGMIVSIEDYFGGKIRNKWVILGVLCAAGFYLVSWLFCMFSLDAFLPLAAKSVVIALASNFDKWYVNMCISSLVAFSLWKYEMWGAGDAKLFIMYSSLIPVTAYSRIYFTQYFASFSLLLATFIPVTFFFFIKAVFILAKQILIGHRKISFKAVSINTQKASIIKFLKVAFGFFVMYLCFFLIRMLFFAFLGVVIPHRNILLLVSFLLFNSLSKFFEHYSKSIIIPLFLIEIILLTFLSGLRNNLVSYLMWSLKYVLVFCVCFMSIKAILHSYIESSNKKTTPFAGWMYLGALIAWIF